MRPAVSRAVTAAATVACAASAAYAVGLRDVGLLAACLSCGVAVGVGWIVVWREPSSPVGPALAWSTAAIAVVTAHVGPLAALPWSSGAWPINLAGLLALLLVFPDGSMPGRVWRAVPWAFATATVAMIVSQWGTRQVDGRLVGGPTAAWAAALGMVSTLTIGACLVLAIVSLVLRHARGDRRTRQQIRWLALAGAVVVALLVGGWIAEASGASLGVAYTPFLVGIVMLVPAAVGVAIVRHDLFDIDRLLSATGSWLLTLIGSAAVFALVVYVVSRALALGTGASSAIASFATALTLLPLQHQLAGWVGRVVDRERQVAVAAVERFAADVRSGRREPEEIQEVLREIEDDPDLLVQVLQPDGGWVRLDGSPVAEPAGFALEAGGDAVARVLLGWDSTRARRRLADVADAAWIPLEVSRLRLGLRAALAEAERSRGRLAEAASLERRRLERDLHDGVQQRVVATGMRLRLLQEHLEPAHAAEVDAAVAELRGTVDEVRRIAQGVRPRQLDDGLGAALEAIRQTTPVPIEVETGTLPEVSAVRALTAYLVVTEAVTNALKHAGALLIRVRVAPDGDRLAVEVTDDGVGGVPEDAPLPALRDRVLSVGGTLRVRSAPGAGTTIRAEI